ncbi:hypothetical protein Tco_0017524 [Tanacetum coccineum]
MSVKEPYTTSHDLKGVIYQNSSKRKRLLGYNKDMPRRKWTNKDQNRTEIMVNLIDKQLLERRMMRNLQRLVSGRELKMYYKIMLRTNISTYSDDGNPTIANIKQALRQVTCEILYGSNLRQLNINIGSVYDLTDEFVKDKTFGMLQNPFFINTSTDFLQSNFQSYVHGQPHKGI